MLAHLCSSVPYRSVHVESTQAADRGICEDRLARIPAKPATECKVVYEYEESIENCALQAERWGVEKLPDAGEGFQDLESKVKGPLASSQNFLKHNRGLPMDSDADSLHLPVFSEQWQIVKPLAYLSAPGTPADTNELVTRDYDLEILFALKYLEKNPFPSKVMNKSELAFNLYSIDWRLYRTAGGTQGPAYGVSHDSSRTVATDVDGEAPVLSVSPQLTTLGNLTPSSTVFFCCDMQERFRPAIKYFGDIISVGQRLLQGARILGIPVIVTEQYPKGLGSTVQEIDLTGVKLVLPKTKFSMVLPEVEAALAEIPGVRSVVLFGVETHVCIQQTALELVGRGVEVHIVADATSSRSMMDRMFALEGHLKGDALFGENYLQAPQEPELASSRREMSFEANMFEKIPRDYEHVKWNKERTTADRVKNICASSCKMKKRKFN
ncbi:PREDICTED: uncharacterized protein LOC105990508 [Dipodomys ordii]|uniref:Isochorismatase domain-containing protein 1 n=1 Tax=Dipodomys ordii TaxID=10020 RepID=A0A1S3FRB7_DIPOR|nr:PREDICTED: uncharacterized protein LOC105990508 [Dipodomys ordii]